jgi:glycosyltransferase involved in cell wall biosynthesis
MVALPEFEHDVIIGADSDADLAASQLPCRAVWVEHSLRREVSPLEDLRATMRLRRVIRRGRYDVVITHQSKAGVVGRLAAATAGRPAVIHSLSMASFGPGYGTASSAVFRALERGLAPVTAAYAVVGKDLARRYTRIGIPEQKCHVIRSGVPLRAPVPVEEARGRVHAVLGVPRCRPLVVYVGSLERRKGAAEIAPFLAALVALCPDAFLAVAGEGPLHATVEAELAALGLTANAGLLGYVSPVHDLIQAAGVVVLLSRAEGISQVLIQAASVGTPFVAYGVDGTTELLDLGATGEVVAIGDVQSAARAAAELLQCRTRGAPIDVSAWSECNILDGYRSLASSALPDRLVPC